MLMGRVGVRVDILPGSVSQKGRRVAEKGARGRDKRIGGVRRRGEASERESPGVGAAASASGDYERETERERGGMISITL